MFVESENVLPQPREARHRGYFPTTEPRRAREINTLCDFLSLCNVEHLPAPQGLYLWWWCSCCHSPAAQPSLESVRWIAIGLMGRVSQPAPSHALPLLVTQITWRKLLSFLRSWSLRNGLQQGSGRRNKWSLKHIFQWGPKETPVSATPDWFRYKWNVFK